MPRPEGRALGAGGRAAVLALALAGALAGGWRLLRAGAAEEIGARHANGADASGPVGEAAYRELLAREAGGEVDPLALAGRAAAIGAALEARLDERARRLSPGAADWRPVWAELLADHPASSEGVLELYREETRRAAEFCRARGLVPMPPALPRIATVENPVLRRLFPLGLYVGDGTYAVTVEPPPERLGRPGADTALDAAPSEAELAAYRRNHCRACVPAIAVHEAYPGHHVAFARLAPGRLPTAGERLPSYQEGWAQYGEVLLWEQGYWDGDAARELGALRLMRLRALRAELDPALHLGRTSREQAERAYRDVAAADPVSAASEVAGHLQSPGRKASYLLGGLQVLALRAAAGEPRGADLRAFHERFLTRVAPVPVVARERFGVEIPALPQRELLPADAP